MPSNCPAITQGYSKSCRDSQGGVAKVWIVAHADIDSYTEASGVMTALTLDAGKVLYLYEQELNTASAVETVTASRTNGTTFWDQTVTLVLHKRSASVSYQIRALAHQDVVIIVQEQTGTNFVFGIKNGLALDPSESTSGVNMGDTNGYTLVFKGMEPYGAFTIAQNIVDGLD
jgi:hypothetical protein